MRNPFLEGKKVYLRAMEESDLNDNYLQWFNDEEVCRYNRHAIFPNNAEKMRDYYASVQNSSSTVVLAIIDKKSDRHIGNASIQNIDWVSRVFEFAMIIGDKKFWSKGYGFEVAVLMISYGFERLNLNKCHSGTMEGNDNMLRLFEKLGMKKEGIRRSAMFKWNQYFDIIEYGVLKKEWKFL